MITDLYLVDAHAYSYQSKTVPLLEPEVRMSDDILTVISALGVSGWVKIPSVSMSDDIETDIAVPDSAIGDMLHVANMAVRRDGSRWVFYFIVGEMVKTKAASSHTIHLSMVVCSSVLSKGSSVMADWSTLPTPSAIPMSLPAVSERIVRKNDIGTIRKLGSSSTVDKQLIEVAVVTAVNPFPTTDTTETGLFAVLGWCELDKSKTESAVSGYSTAKVIVDGEAVKDSTTPLIGGQDILTLMMGKAKSTDIIGVFASPVSAVDTAWDESKDAWVIYADGRAVDTTHYKFFMLRLPYHKFGLKHVNNVTPFNGLTKEEIAYGGRLTVIDQSGQCIADLPPDTTGYTVQTIIDASGYTIKLIPYDRKGIPDDLHAAAMTSTPLSWAGDAWKDYAKSQLTYDREIMHQSIKALTDGRSLSTAGDIAGQTIAMAAAGATIGLMGGPIGAGAGALVGALAGAGTSATGTVSRWVQTDNQIRQIKASQTAKENLYKNLGASNFVPTSAEHVIKWLQHKVSMTVSAIVPMELYTGAFTAIASQRGYPADEISIQKLNAGCYQGVLISAPSTWHHVQLENEFAAGIRFI